MIVIIHRFKQTNGITFIVTIFCCLQSSVYVETGNIPGIPNQLLYSIQLCRMFPFNSLCSKISQNI